MSGIVVGSRDRNGAPTVAVNFTDPAINRDPFPIFQELRRLGPIVYNEATEAWMVTRFDPARQVLRQATTFDQDTVIMLEAVGGHHLTTIQPPLHTTVRGVFRHEFQRDTLQNWRDLVGSVIDDLMLPLIGDVREGATVDFVPDAIHRIPALVISGMLGIRSEGDRFRNWVLGMIGIMNSLLETDPVKRAEIVRRGIEAREEALRFCHELLTERRANPGGGDLVSLLAASAIGNPDPALDGDEEGAGRTHMRERDLTAQVAQLVIAAQDNTANMMSASLVYLARHPAVRERLIADRSLVPDFIEELLRHHGSIMVTPRLVLPGGAEIAGVEIEAGERMWVMNGCANRDETRWEDPERFDIDREVKANIAFGFGGHNCIGVNLARLELAKFVNLVLDEIPEYTLADDEVDYGSMFFTRGPQSVRVRIGARTTAPLEGEVHG